MRAYLIILDGDDPDRSKPDHPVPYNYLADEGGTAVAYTATKNDGQTPAYQYTTYMAVGVFPNPLPGDFQFPGAPETSFDGSDGTQNRIYSHASIRKYDVSDIAKIISGVDAIYVYGTVTYDDVFKKSHFINFCMQYAITNWSPLTYSNDLYCQTHNNSDDDPLNRTSHDSPPLLHDHPHWSRRPVK